MKLNQKYIENFLKTINIKNCGKVIKKNNEYLFLDCRYIKEDPMLKSILSMINNFCGETLRLIDGAYNAISFPISVNYKSCYDLLHETSYCEQWQKYQKETKEERNNN